METLKHNSTAVAEQNTLPAALPAQQTILTEDQLSPLQTERYLYASMMYGDEVSLRIVSATTSHGLSSWESTSAKITTISECRGKKDDYFNQIGSNITIDRMYTDREIIKFISSIRTELGLPPYLKNILKNCIHDFLMYHIPVQVKGDEDPKTGKPTIIGYIPVVNLNSQI